jgi:hypothetical protein
VKRVSRTTFLVFAIISLVVGTFFMAFWTFILVFSLVLDAKFPGTILSQEGYFIVYFALSIGIVFIIVAIILFVLRAKKAD